MLIDSSYFTSGPRHITNASIGSNLASNVNEVNEVIVGYISYYQEEFLMLALGASLGRKVNCYLVCKDEGDRLNVENYEIVCNKLKEAFADYVFFHIMRYGNSQQTITGTVRLKCANDYLSPICRQVDIWNDMVKKNKLFAEWVQSDECPLGNISIDAELLTNINQFNI